MFILSSPVSSWHVSGAHRPRQRARYRTSSSEPRVSTALPAGATTLPRVGADQYAATACYSVGELSRAATDSISVPSRSRSQLKSERPAHLWTALGV